MNHTNNINPFNGYGFYEEATGYDSIREQKETLKVVDNTFIVDGYGVVDKFPSPTPSKPKYLTFTATDEYVSLGFGYICSPDTPVPTFDMQYRLGTDDEWQPYTVCIAGSEMPVIDLNEGDSVQFKGVNPNGFYYDNDNVWYHVMFITSGGVSASGDITSIVNGVGGNCALPSNCFYRMFSGCTSLTTAPELPATTLSEGCYQNMFYECTSLETAPELPATTLADYCYSGMFNGCTSLETAPALPATTLSSDCYSNMFQGCTSLTTAPELPATTLADYCYSYMFNVCTSLETAPELPATTLADYCYSGMFNGCTSLKSVTCLATDISATDCTDSWLFDVAQTGTFYKSASMSDWTEGDSGIPSGWTVEDVGIEVFQNFSTLIIKADEMDEGTGYYNINNGTNVPITNKITAFQVTQQMNNSVLKVHGSFGGEIKEETTTLKYVATPPNDEIWYTSTDGNIVEFNYDEESPDSAFGATSLSNTYSNGKGVIKLDGNAQYVGNSVFNNLDTLSSISLPNSVESVDESAFEQCHSLLSIVIPDSVTNLGDNAFGECTSLLYVSIPNSVISIGYGSFNGCVLLTSVEIPESMNAISNNMFSGCTSLTSVTIPNSVEEIGQNAFYGCQSLTSVTIPNSVEEIGQNAFYGCTSLTSIDIPYGCTSLTGTFCDCTSLTSVTIPNSVEVIGYEAFYYCTSLTSINIPSSVSSINHWAFYGCTSLSSITVDSNNQYYDSRDNCNAIIETSTNKLIIACKTTVIPNTVTIIGDHAFDNLPITGDLVLPDGITLLETGAFMNCNRLNSITVGPNVTSMGEDCFNGCTSLSYLKFLMAIPPQHKEGMLSDTNDCILYVPSAYVDTYKTAWPYFASRIQAIPV